MTFFKYLIGSILLSSPLATEGVDGWFSVEKVQKGEDRAEEDDPSIWVIFAKRLSSETFQIRFPEDPNYRYTETGGFEVAAEREGEILQLTVQPAGAEVPEDLLYQSEGKWVYEHFIQTADHLYHLKTTSLTADSEASRAFIFSLLIEKNS
jgi:hypothetical protein